MAMVRKVVSGLGKVGKALTEPNTVANGGGLSALLVPRRFTAPGAITVLGGMGAISVANEGIKGRNNAMIGKISYDNGPARMTAAYVSGATQAMHRVSGGNYEVFSDMAEEVVSSGLETYGATPALISSLYHMGGR